MAGGQVFVKHWEALSQPNATPSKRAETYIFLTSYLKDANVSPDFISSLCNHQKPLTKLILSDVTQKSSCEHAALQVLGYCLHNPDFADIFSKEEARLTIAAICGIMAHEETDKNLCTRALWCLANQSFPASHCSPEIPNMISMVGAVVKSQRYSSPTVDSEALSLLVRLSQQCPVDFARLANLWYKPILHLLLCKIIKLQRKALNLATSFEENLCDNHELLHWLVKELKENVVATMLKLLSEKGHDHCLVLTIWSHFVHILGRSLHKHGSFLNELLKVVEMGFKHKLFVVQVAAYNAWKVLITNFSTDISLLTNPKRLKLLLMPLLASAVREQHYQVEYARLLTWWHLISCLKDKRRPLFKQVCIPFLMFCLGLDPKLDLSQLSTVLSDLNSRRPISSTNTPNQTNSHSTLVSHSHATPTRTEESTSKESGVLPSPQDRLESPATGQNSLSKTGSLFSLIVSPRTPAHTPGSKRQHGSDRYQNIPSLPVVVSGCHAMLQFLGGKGGVSQSLLKEELVGDTFPRFLVPLDIVQFFFLFLDGLFMCSAHYAGRIEDGIVDLVISQLVSVIFNTMNPHLRSQPTFPLSLVELLLTDRAEEHIGEGTRKDIISQFCSLPHPSLATTNSNGVVVWKAVLARLMKSNRTSLSSTWFQSNWKRIITMATEVPNCLPNFQYLTDQLDNLVHPNYLDRSGLASMWSHLASCFVDYIKETSQVNAGTALDPDFTAARRILKFPFQQLLMFVTRGVVASTLHTWKSLYDVINIHISLLVKVGQLFCREVKNSKLDDKKGLYSLLVMMKGDPNLCAEIICNDLYVVYGQNAKIDASTLDSRGQMIKFDLYQNGIATALQCVASKLNWGSKRAASEGVDLAKGSEGGEGRGGVIKSIQPLMSLVAWQLATFWDSMKKPFINLGQLSTPYTLFEILSVLYRSFPSSEVILFATELIAEPLATVWEKALSSQLPSVRSRPKPPCDLHEQITILWKNIMTCFQSRYTQPFDSRLLSVLSPLLVITLSSKKQSIINPTLNFWSLTFDKASHLTYPHKLYDTFSAYLKSMKTTLQFRLPGFGTTKEVVAVEDSLPTSGVSQFSEMQTQEEEKTVVLPNPSPQKGVRGSFLNRMQSPRKPPPQSNLEKSPAVKSMDKILENSRAKQLEQRSTDVGSPVRSAKKAGQSPAFPVRRKLSLSEEESYVAVPPPTKKRRLLTEHQKEKMREKRDIPTLYNALDPSQDSMQPPFTEDQSLTDSPTGTGDGDDPIIIPESEVSPATPVSMRRGALHHQPPPPPPPLPLPLPPPPPPPAMFSHLPPSQSATLPPEAMDTNAQSEFPIPQSGSIPKPPSARVPPGNTRTVKSQASETRQTTRKSDPPVEVIDIDKTPPLSTPLVQSTNPPHVTPQAPVSAATAHAKRNSISDVAPPHPQLPIQTDSIHSGTTSRDEGKSGKEGPPRQRQPVGFIQSQRVSPAGIIAFMDLGGGAQVPSSHASTSHAPPKLFHAPPPYTPSPRPSPPILVPVTSVSCPQSTKNVVAFSQAIPGTVVQSVSGMRSHSLKPIAPKVPTDPRTAMLTVVVPQATSAVLTHPVTHTLASAVTPLPRSASLPQTTGLVSPSTVIPTRPLTHIPNPTTVTPLTHHASLPSTGLVSPPTSVRTHPLTHIPNPITVAPLPYGSLMLPPKQSVPTVLARPASHIPSPTTITALPHNASLLPAAQSVPNATTVLARPVSHIPYPTTATPLTHHGSLLPPTEAVRPALAHPASHVPIITPLPCGPSPQATTKSVPTATTVYASPVSHISSPTTITPLSHSTSVPSRTEHASTATTVSNPPPSPTNALFQVTQVRKAILDATVQMAQENYQKLHPSAPRSGTTYNVPTSMPTPHVRISPHMSPQMLAGSTPIAFVTVNDNPKYLVVSHDAEVGNGQLDSPMPDHPPTASSPNISANGQYQVPPAAVSSGPQSLQTTWTSTNNQVSATFQQRSVGVRSPGATVTSEGLSTKSAAVPTANVRTSGLLQSSNKLTTPLSPPAIADKTQLPVNALEGEISRAKSTQSLQLKRRGRGRKPVSQLVRGTPPNLLQASSRTKRAVKKTKKHVYKARENGVLEEAQQEEFATEVSRASDGSSSTARGKEPYCSEDPLVRLLPSDAEKDVGQNVKETLNSASEFACGGSGSAVRDKDAKTIKVDLETSTVSRTGSDTAVQIGQSDEREVRVSGGVGRPVHNSTEEGRLEVDSSPMDVSEHADPGTLSKPVHSDSSHQEAKLTDVSEHADPETLSKPVHSDPSHQEAKLTESTLSSECTTQDPAKLGGAIPGTPTADVQTENGTFSSPKDTPAGILKHTSQFDTPFSAVKSRHVQFARNPVMIEPDGERNRGEEETYKTPKHGRGSRTPQSAFSSRRTLLMSHSPPTKLIMVNKPTSTPPPSSSTEPIYPSLATCHSPVEQILPVLSPSNRFTHGLVQLVHARNIRTVGNISSLTPQQVQTLPIKSPKVVTLKTALRTFEQQLGSKHRLSGEDELLPPAKQSRTSQPSSTSDSVGSSEQPNGVCQEGQVSEKTSDFSMTDSQDLVSSGSIVENEREHVISLSTPDSQLMSEEIPAVDSGGGPLDEQSLNETRAAAADTSSGDIEPSEMDTTSTMEKPLETNLEPLNGTSVNHPSPKMTTENTEHIVTDNDSTQLPQERKPEEESEELSAFGDHRSPTEEATSMETEPSNSLPPLEQDEVASKEVTTQCAGEEPNVITQELHQGTAALLDHSYCSQETSRPSLQPQESEGVNDGLEVATKLSLVNNDHTYCYSSDLALEQPSSLPDTKTQSEEQYLAKSEETEPTCSSESQSDTSQELFSCNQNNLDEVTNDEQEHMDASVDSNSGTPSSSESHHAECSQMVTRDTQTTTPDFSNTAVNTDLTTAIPQVSVSVLQAMVGRTTTDTGILTGASVEELLALQEKLFELQQLVQQLLSKAMRERP